MLCCVNLCIRVGKSSNVSVTDTRFNPSLKKEALISSDHMYSSRLADHRKFTLLVTLQELQLKKFACSVDPLAGFEYTAWLFSLTRFANKRATVSLRQHTCVYVCVCVHVSRMFGFLAPFTSSLVVCACCRLYGYC